MADNFAVIDATEATLTFKSTDNDGVHTPEHKTAKAPRVISGKRAFLSSDFSGGAAAVGAVATPLFEGVHILNPSENAQTIWVGGVGITDDDGWPVLAGESTPLIRVNDLAWVFIYALDDVTVRYMGF